MRIHRAGIHTSGSRRGIALAAVLLTGLGLLLVVLGLLHSVRAGVSSIGGTEDAIQTRLAARSAVRGFAAILARDRDEMLRGLSPDPSAAFELFELPGGDPGRLAVARLIPLGSSGALVVGESGRLDLNSVDATALEATGLFTALEAEVVIAARDARPDGRFNHVSDLLAIEGDGAPGATRVLGPLDEISILSRVDDAEESVGDRIKMRLDAELGSGTRPIVDVFTVHSFEPDVDARGGVRLRPGLDESASDFEGRLETQALMERVLTGGTPEGESDGPTEAAEPAEDQQDSEPEADPVPTSSEALVSALRRASVSTPGADVGSAFDGLTIHEGGWRNGLLDINTAPVEALQGIPGIDSSLAAAIVARRESVAEDRRFDRFWPVAEELVEPAAWDVVVPRISTRSLLWRAILVVGLVPGDEPEGPLQSPVAWEVVVDCGLQTPRIVELRDVTLLELTARLLAAAGEADSEFSSAAPLAGEQSSGSVDEGLFDDSPLFTDGPLFDEPPLFDDLPLFDGASLFEDDSLFESAPLFGGNGSTSLFGGGSEGAGTEDDSSSATVPRDRGPGGRWRSSASSG